MADHSITDTGNFPSGTFEITPNKLWYSEDKTSATVGRALKINNPKHYKPEKTVQDRIGERIAEDWAVMSDEELASLQAQCAVWDHDWPDHYIPSAADPLAQRSHPAISGTRCTYCRAEKP